MELNLVTIERAGYTAIVRINRPDKLNALNAQTLIELKEAFQQLADDKQVYTIILTGTGEKAFVAGADIAELNSLDEITAYSFSQKGQDVFTFIENMEKPVIAAVNGFALGGGCELALCCHIRIAGDNAKFALPETGLGIIPGFGGTQRLPRLVNQGTALGLILSGEMIDAQEALRIGLVSKVFPQAELMDRVMQFVSSIESKGQFAVRHALRAVKGTREMTPEDGMAFESQLFSSCCASEDFKEGTGAFLAKRKPAFQNHE